MSADSFIETTVVETGPANITELFEWYNIARSQNAQISDVVRVLQAIAARDTAEDSTIALINETLATLSALILKNTNEIQYLHNLVGLLVFELIEKGVKIENKKLINELKLYAKNGK